MTDSTEQSFRSYDPAVDSSAQAWQAMRILHLEDEIAGWRMLADTLADALKGIEKMTDDNSVADQCRMALEEHNKSRMA